MKSYSAGWLDDHQEVHSLAAGQRQQLQLSIIMVKWWWWWWCNQLSIHIIVGVVVVCWCVLWCVLCVGLLWLFVFGVWNSATDKILLNTVTHGVIALMDKYHLWMVDGTSASSWFKENLYMDLCSCYQNWIHQLTLIRKWDISNPCFLIGISATRGRDILHLQMKIDRGMWATRVTAHLLPFPPP